MMVLPVPARRHWLLAFWLVATLICGMSVGILLALFLSAAWLLFGLTLAAGLALPGLIRPQIAVLPYRVWNKVSRRVGRCLSFVLMTLCYYIVFVGVRYGGAGGSSLRLRPLTSNVSMWEARATALPAAYFSPASNISGRSAKSGWIFNYVSWVVTSGNFWVFALLPFLILLSLLDTDDQTPRFPENIYTLF